MIWNFKRELFISCFVLLITIAPGFSAEEKINKTVNLTPTPTISPYYFYDPQMVTIYNYLNQWRNQIGIEEASKKGLEWLNGHLKDGPPIPEGIKEARISETHGVNYVIKVVFVDGAELCIDFRNGNEIMGNSSVTQEKKPNIKYIIILLILFVFLIVLTFYFLKIPRNKKA